MDNNKVVISVESTCDLPNEILNKWLISLINMQFSVDDKEYVMGDAGLSAKDFYDCMRRGAMTRTAQVNEHFATEHLRAILEDGKDVVHLAFSSSLSGTYNSFVAAKEALREEFPERRIEIIDSLSACAGQGYLAVNVAEYSLTHSFEETVEYARAHVQRTLHFFVVDDLKYLARGGRISKATAMLGNAIHMKPVMHMNKEGCLVAYKKVLSRKKSILTLAELTCAKYDKATERIYIAHADCYGEASALAANIQKGTGVAPEIMDLGPIIGSHSGPGTIAVFFSGKERE